MLAFVRIVPSRGRLGGSRNPSNESQIVTQQRYTYHFAIVCVRLAASLPIISIPTSRPLCHYEWGSVFGILWSFVWDVIVHVCWGGFVCSALREFAFAMFRECREMLLCEKYVYAFCSQTPMMLLLQSTLECGLVLHS